MSRREEVERLKAEILVGIEHGDYHKNSEDALERLAALAIPDRYTPREEVSVGFWFARHIEHKRWAPVSVWKDDLRGDVLMVACIATTYDYPFESFTDFLPVPAWLVEGLGEKA